MSRIGKLPVAVPAGALRRRIFRELLNALLIAMGVFSAGMGIEGFLVSSHFIDGGVTGISMLTAKVSPLPLSVLLPMLNLPFIEALPSGRYPFRWRPAVTGSADGASVCDAGRAIRPARTDAAIGAPCQRVPARNASRNGRMPTSS